MEQSVHVTRCTEYDPGRIKKQVKEHLDLYPKFKDLTGKKILLKINLLSASDPKKAITTHPVFTKEVVLELQERGAKVIIGDSPGGLFNPNSLKKAYEATGMTKIAEETGCELNFNTDSHIEKLSEGKFTKSFNICDYSQDCDLIIAIPKIKTHMFCGFTCASKIMFGVIPGTEKVKYHTRFPSMIDFSKMLLDLTDLSKVDLFLVEGILGMDEKGPSQGNPRDVGLIVSGIEHTSIDLQISRMVGLDPEKLPIMIAARDLDIIKFDEKIKITGDGADFKLDPPFKPAKGGALLTDPPRFLRRMSIYLSTNKPVISHKKCVGCGICAENCAGETIKIVNNKAKISYSNCIRCYCCHELCPHEAVYLSMKESGLMNYVTDLAWNYFIGKEK
jgi:uncharacterized protein (DUF362 family)/Pyruvate/2-oxoacid:ferredoxin oxidoreductase delta subunit